MPKKGSIHTKYNEIKVIFTNGEEITTRSALETKDGSRVLKLDVDPYTHSAWTGVFNSSSRAGTVTKFNNKFSGINFTAKK